MVKKWCMLLVLALCLSGCGRSKDFETVSDSYVIPQAVAAKAISLTLPDEAASPVSVTGSGEQLYICDGYSITVQTMDGGDLDKTFRTVTGYSRDSLTVMTQQQDAVTRYDCVWTSAGEGGDQVGRTAILDDGSYHYVLSVMAPSADAGAQEQTWQRLFESFRVG